MPFVGTPIDTPSALLAVAATVATTEAPYGRFDEGSKMRTESFSANVTLPAIALPSIVTLNAFFVATRFIDCVNRTEIPASRATLVVDA